MKVSEGLAADFKDYASAHATPGNQACHVVGLPLVVLSVLGLLCRVVITGGEDFFRVDVGSLVWFLATLFYLYKDWKIAVPFSLAGAGLYFLGRAIPLPAHVAIFIASWIVQFVGHGVFEKKKPAFLRSMKHLLIGPLWLFAKTIGYE